MTAEEYAKQLVWDSFVAAEDHEALWRLLSPEERAAAIAEAEGRLTSEER